MSDINRPHPQIAGIIPLGTSLDCESERTRKLGCWDGFGLCKPFIEKWSVASQRDDFEPEEQFCNFLIDVGFGKNCDKSVRDFWVKEIKKNYKGDAGRRRARMATINLAERDGLHSRLPDVKCPVMWLHVRFPLLSQDPDRYMWQAPLMNCE